MKLPELDTQSAFDLALEGTKGLVVIDCYTSWCGPCKGLAPLLEKAADEHTTVKFYKLNIEVNTAVSESHEISSIPTLLFYKNRQFIGEFRGANITGILEVVNKHK